MASARIKSIKPAATRSRDLAAARRVLRHATDAITALGGMLAREHRTELAKACFDFLPHRAELDLAVWDEVDIFAH